MMVIVETECLVQAFSRLILAHSTEAFSLLRKFQQRVGPVCMFYGIKVMCAYNYSVLLC